MQFGEAVEDFIGYDASIRLVDYYKLWNEYVYINSWKLYKILGKP